MIRAGASTLLVAFTFVMVKIIPVIVERTASVDLRAYFRVQASETRRLTPSPTPKRFDDFCYMVPKCSKGEVLLPEARESAKPTTLNPRLHGEPGAIF